MPPARPKVLVDGLMVSSHEGAKRTIRRVGSKLGQFDRRALLATGEFSLWVPQDLSLALAGMEKKGEVVRIKLGVYRMASDTSPEVILQAKAVLMEESLKAKRIAIGKIIELMVKFGISKDEI